LCKKSGATTTYRKKGGRGLRNKSTYGGGVRFAGTQQRKKNSGSGGDSLGPPGRKRKNRMPDQLSHTLDEIVIDPYKERIEKQKGTLRPAHWGEVPYAIGVTE